MPQYLTRSAALEQLEALRHQVRNGNMGTVSEEFDAYHWGGGGVIVSTRPSRVQPDPWRSRITYVRTSHAATVGWLFCTIRDSMPWQVTGVCKEEMYETMAESMVGYQAFLAGSPEDQVMLVLAALDGLERHIMIVTSTGDDGMMDDEDGENDA